MNKLKKYNLNSSGSLIKSLFSLGSVFIFLSVTDNDFVAKNQSIRYQEYLFYVGIILVLISLGVFIVRYNSNDMKVRLFVKRNEVSLNNQRYLVPGMIYRMGIFRLGAASCLEAYDLQTPESKEVRRSLFRKSWGIYSQDTAINQIENLINRQSVITDSADLFDRVEQINDQQSFIYNFYKSIIKLKVWNFQTEDIYIKLDDIKRCQSTDAWDLFRAANLAQTCYNIGYIDEEHAWSYLGEIYQLIEQKFDSWEVASISFLLGRALWANEPDQSKYVEYCSELFTYFPSSKIDDMYFNPYRKYPLHLKK